MLVEQNTATLWYSVGKLELVLDRQLGTPVDSGVSCLTVCTYLKSLLD